jgi:hypothetical protein
MHVDVDVDMNCAALDPATLSVLLPSPASTDSSREWNSHPQSTHPNAAHGDGSDYFSQSGTATATTQKCEEQDPENNTGAASDWVAGDFTLNTKVGEHQRAMRTFIEACQRGFLVELDTHASPFGCNTPNELSPTLSTFTFMETTLRLATELLALVSEDMPSSSEQVEQRTRADADADLEASRSNSAQSSDFPSTRGQPVIASSSSLEDTANILLLLSCYTRLLCIFSSVFKCFHHTLTANCASLQSNPNHALGYILTYLPKLYIGTLSFQANPRLALRMVLDSVQNIVAELTRGMMRVVQFVDRNDDESITSPKKQMPEEEGLVDCSLEQKAQVSDSTHSPSRARANLKASKGCGEPLSLPDRECAAAGSEQRALLDSWRTTIHTVSSTASNTIMVLKEAIV